MVAPIFILAIGITSWGSAQTNGRPPIGQHIYDEHCARCHGLTARGNGPDAKSLIVPPANLHGRRSRMRTDLELLTIIEFGIVYSPMHGWQGRLTEDEMLELVGYIRTLAPFDPL